MLCSCTVTAVQCHDAYCFFPVLPSAATYQSNMQHIADKSHTAQPLSPVCINQTTISPRALTCAVLFLCRYASGSELPAVQQLLDEVLAAAQERALEPQLLEGVVLERIVASKQSTT